MDEFEQALGDPDHSGSSEHRAIRECIMDALDTEDCESTADSVALAISMLDEFAHWAQTLRFNVADLIR